MLYPLNSVTGWRRDKKAGFVDTSGRLVIPVVYDYAFTFSQGEALVKKDGKWIVIRLNTSR